MSRQFRFVLFLVLSLTALTACQVVETGLPALAPTQAAFVEYTVQPGDTLGAIAARFHVTTQELSTLNASRYPSLSTNPGLIQPGWQLLIPSASVTVTTTDTPSASTSPSDVPHADLLETAQLIVQGINAARAGQRLQSLSTDPTLTRIASLRSTDMIDRNYFSHYEPGTGQEGLLHDIQVLHYSYQYAGENIAEIQNEAGWVPSLLTVAARYSASELSNQLVQGWLNSPEHRANIMNVHYRRTGVALAVSQDGRRIVATEIFSD